MKKVLELEDVDPGELVQMPSEEFREQNRRRAAQEEALRPIALKAQNLFAEVRGESPEKMFDRMIKEFPAFAAACEDAHKKHFTRKPRRAPEHVLSGRDQSHRVGIGDPSGHMTPTPE